MRKPIVAGNWKMNGSRAMAAELVEAIRAGVRTFPNVDVALCPPIILIPLVRQLLADSTLVVGAQNVANQLEGAFTGETSANMLVDHGCQCVIVGHSERRALYGEDNQLVADKVLLAAQSGLQVIACVGETLADREAGRTNDVVGEQLAPVLDNITTHSLEDIVIAYEPVWAIGTGLTATPEQAQSVHEMIRQTLATADATLAEKTRILYGGSVKADNAAGLFSQADIDGGLIGGAALAAPGFIEICRAANDNGGI